MDCNTCMPNSQLVDVTGDHESMKRLSNGYEIPSYFAVLLSCGRATGMVIPDGSRIALLTEETGPTSATCRCTWV